MLVPHFLPCFFSMYNFNMHWIFQVFQATTKVFLHKEDWQFAALQFYVQTFSHLISASLNLAVDS